MVSAERRKFPAPWRVEALPAPEALGTVECTGFKVVTGNDLAVAYVYGCPDQRSNGLGWSALTIEEARLLAHWLAKLPELAAAAGIRSANIANPPSTEENKPP